MKIGAVLLVVAAIVAGVWFATRAPEPPNHAVVQQPAVEPAFVGSAACRSCHAKQFTAWEPSQHALAMQPATEATVRGDFSGAKFREGAVESVFARREGRFVVRTDGADGALADFDVKYAFGIEPLQQYLLEMPGGRLQALSVAWDARPKAQGGARWFHLYAGQGVDHRDELHWTRPAQNWNFMCADCHSTGLRKNFDATVNRYRTEWSEMSVGCEACHGPGSRHIEWVNASKVGNGRDSDATKGLTARLDERRGIAWIANDSGTARRSVPRSSGRELDVCAQCHARRGQIADGYVAGRPFLDHYRPALLTSPLYHADGQQRDEVYNWGSFLQSRMHAQGVSCSDCHEPHGAKLRVEGNGMCAQCHAAAKFDASAHHRHAAGSAGARCTACHMPATTYMGVDPRHDHSLRVPRPDLSVRLGTPNACNDCHASRDARWAAAQVKRWYGRDAQGYQRHADAFAAANAAAGGTAGLVGIATDMGQAAIVRASALAGISNVTSAGALQAIASGLRDADAIVRLGAMQALEHAPAPERARLAPPLLSDPLRVIRTEAAGVLAGVPLATPEQRAAFDRAAAEYVDTQRYNADRVEARVNLGAFEARRGNADTAERELVSAVTLDGDYAPASINLADLYRALGRESDAERVLRAALDRSPKHAPLHHALGLALVRAKRSDEALAALASATRLDPGNARFAYVYGVALHSAGRVGEAIAVLERTSGRHPEDQPVLEALAAYHGQRGDRAKAQKYVDRLRGTATSNTP